MTQQSIKIQAVQKGCDAPNLELKQITDYEKTLITIEFAPTQDDEYSCPQPKFIFGDRVVTREQEGYCRSKNLPIPSAYSITISAMELVQTKTPSGQLLTDSYWKYGIRSTRGTKELIWFAESALLPYQ